MENFTIRFSDMDSGTPGSREAMEDFSNELQKHHLAQILAAKYQNDPKLLGEHYDVNLTPLPPQEAHGDDPARDSKVLLLSHKPEYNIPNFGNHLIPENVQGKNCWRQH